MDATNRLGVIYEELRRKDQRFSESIRLYSEAIKQGHEEAMYRLARIYHLCKCVESDYQKAYDLYTKAAELGYSKFVILLPHDPFQRRDEPILLCFYSPFYQSMNHQSRKVPHHRHSLLC